MKPTRPLAASVFAALLGLGGLAMGYVGLSVHGFLLPALALLTAGALMWFGRSPRVLVTLVVLNLFGELLSDLVMEFGHGLGAHRLDVSGVGFLLNLATGGPPMTGLAVPMLLMLWLSPRLRAWFGLPGAVDARAVS